MRLPKMRGKDGLKSSTAVVEKVYSEQALLIEVLNPGCGLRIDGAR